MSNKSGENMNSKLIHLIPLVWMEAKYHTDDWIFRLDNFNGYKSKNEKSVMSPNLLSALSFIQYGPQIFDLL